MATKRFGIDFDAATTPLDGTETLSIVQDGVTVDCTTQDIADLSGGLSNPMTTAEDLIKGGVAGVPARLAVGTDGQVLTVTAGVVGWAAPTGGFSNPMTTEGDIITGGTAGAAQRLGVGAEGEVLTVVSGVPAWAAGGGGSSGYTPGAVQYLECRPQPNSSTWSVLGMGSPSTTGSAVVVGMNTTNKGTLRPRIRYRQGTASTSAVVGLREGNATYFRGSGSVGGFSFAGGWMMVEGTTVSTHRVFYGFSTSNTVPVDVNPSTLTDIIGFGYDAADTNVQFFHNDGSGTATKVDTGIAKPATNESAAFFVQFSCSAAGNVSYSVTEIISGATFSGTATTDLPTTATLRFNAFAGVGGTSSTIGCEYYAFGVSVP